MPSSGVHRGLQQPVGPDPGSWRRLRGRARSRWRCWLPGRPARASASSIITQAASHGKSGQRRPSPRHRQPAQELRGGLFPLLRNLTIKIYNRQGRTQRGCTGCTCIPPGLIWLRIRILLSLSNKKSKKTLDFFCSVNSFGHFIFENKHGAKLKGL